MAGMSVKQKRKLNGRRGFFETENALRPTPEKNGGEN
jgi:hypothetical protein